MPTDPRNEGTRPMNPGVVGRPGTPADLYPHTGVRGPLQRMYAGPTNFHPEDYRAVSYEGRDDNGAQPFYKPFSRGHYAGKGPRGFARSDERLQELVCDVLMDAPDIDPSEVEVSVKGGVVTLGGSVVSRRMKRITADTVESIPGVMDVHNNLEVKPMTFGDEARS
jgi:osmotically-inducible protein OsmY